MAATIKDIVRETGLSLGTVSKFLNGIPIKPANEEKIRAAIKKCNYRVNEFGRNLKTNRSHTVGFIMPRLDDPFAAELIDLVGRYLREYNYSTVICNLDADLDSEEKSFEYLFSRRVDGIMFFPLSENPVYNTYAHKLPVVAFDTYSEDLSADTIVLDNRRAARDATRYLLENGHRKIAILSGAGAYSGRLRYEGFCDAMKEAGAAICDRYVYWATYNIPEQALSLATELLSLPDPPTAVLACNYFFTIGVIVASERLGLKLGRDISLIGFDRMYLTDIFWPDVAFVRQPLEEMARLGVERIMKRIRGGKEETKLYLLPAEVIPGTSVGHPTPEE